MKTGPDYIQLYPLLRCNRSTAQAYHHTGDLAAPDPRCTILVMGH